MADESLRLWEAWRTRGDERAFEDLVRPDLGRAVALARAEGCPPSEAEDAVQESLIRLARERSDTPSRVGVRGWFFGVVRDRARSRLRGDLRRRQREHEAARAESVSDDVPRFALREEVDRALAGLQEEEREAIRLRYLLDLEYREVAYVLGVSEGACRMRVLRALKRIRGALGAGAGAALAAVVFPAPNKAGAWSSAATCGASASTIAVTAGGTLLMTTVQKVTVATVLVVTLGAALGAGIQVRRFAGDLSVARARADAEAAVATDLRRQLDERGAELENLRRQGSDLHQELARLREREDRLAAEAQAPAAAGDRSGANPNSQSESVEELVAAARAAIKRNDAAGALAAVRTLAGVVPGGRSPAMALVAELEEAREELDVSDVAWGAFLASPEVTDLLGWSLGRASPEAFREIAADTLPNLVPPETLIARFREALLTEEDEDVRRSMVEGLTDHSSPESKVALAELFGDARVAIPVRVQIVTHLSLSDAPETVQDLRAALEGAPSALAAGIRAALSAKDLSEDGFLVTGFVNGEVENRGLQVGDLLLSYDGRGAAGNLNAAIRNALGRDGFVTLDLLRAGARVTLEVRPGWLGLIGRVLQVPERR